MSGSLPTPTSPDFTLGILGAGQLGRMLALAARRMNVRTVVWTGGLEAPAVELANHVIDLPFDSLEGREQFCELATLATVEFENIPRGTLDAVAGCMPLHPSPDAIAICQNREREKGFLRHNGIPCTWFAVVASAEELAAALKELNGPGVLKTAAFGYDGKGQLKLNGGEDAAAVWADFGSDRAILEAWVPFELELSVMVARGADGSMVTYDPAENRHRHHILDVSIVPARVSEEVAARAQQIARQVAEALDYRGILGVEFFLLPDGTLLVNEMAPRPHNSGHHTIDACATSQFEQQLRAVCGLALGSTRLLSPVVMLNLLGDFWPDETVQPDWTPLFEDGEAFLHLYGKRRAIGRRKMGHANLLGPTAEDALARAEAFKAKWLLVSGR
ncbi:5-(carboxyamino)imidazole ribonucleotide synthase [Luteolibacter ambystomatis]|uniref:N5-carboxyaminoimidazole ribonucleotide synthase n=1 Tax=Luteolibacter ambystomatis TaxID=2824561 RepID=A0A975G7P3_9BACT|nr:5-(carboxyamino)imidazole ribonucleotide synthase [Luteolibacter ambystomatis]QUE50291.1 5-(carboxyamino)imidazole ribonucleotide synthase [Luteolibacter ambystomatis]